jgi:ferritin-like metal-binding protein YciE
MGGGAHLNCSLGNKTRGDGMKWVSEDFQNLRSLWVSQLRVLLSAEEQIVRALPDMITHASDEQLRGAFQAHLLETEVHIKRLEQILAEQKRVDASVGATGPMKCKAITAIKAEAEDIFVDARDAWVRDAALIGAAQRVEHYEIASYGTVRQWALLLGETAAAELLDRTAKEEGHTDHLLTEIAERVNPKAKAA